MSSRFPTPILGFRFFYHSLNEQTAQETVKPYEEFLAAFGEVKVGEKAKFHDDRPPEFHYEFAGAVYGLENPEETFERLIEKLGTAWYRVSEGTFDVVLDIRSENAHFTLANLNWAWVFLYDKSEEVSE